MEMEAYSLILIISVVCLPSIGSEISRDAVEICSNNGSVYHDIQQVGVIQTLNANIGEGLLTPQQLPSYYCYLTLDNLKYGTWIYLNLTYIDIRSVRSYLKIRNRNSNPYPWHTDWTQDSLEGSAVRIITDHRFREYNRYLLVFFLMLNEDNPTQAVRIVLSYTVADVIHGLPGDSSVISTSSGYIVSHSAFDYGKTDNDSYPIQAFNKTKTLQIDPSNQLSINVLYFDLAVGDYLEISYKINQGTQKWQVHGRTDSVLPENITLIPSGTHVDFIFVSRQGASGAGFMLQYSQLSTSTNPTVGRARTNPTTKSATSGETIVVTGTTFSVGPEATLLPSVGENSGQASGNLSPTTPAVVVLSTRNREHLSTDVTNTKSSTVAPTTLAVADIGIRTSTTVSSLMSSAEPTPNITTGDGVVNSTTSPTLKSPALPTDIKPDDIMLYIGFGTGGLLALGVILIIIGCVIWLCRRKRKTDTRLRELYAMKNTHVERVTSIAFIPGNTTGNIYEMSEEEDCNNHTYKTRHTYADPDDLYNDDTIQGSSSVQNLAYHDLENSNTDDCACCGTAEQLRPIRESALEPMYEPMN